MNPGNSKDIVLICHNLRSCHNIGSILRTAEGLGVAKIFFTGYTPYPLGKNDDRLPNIALKINKRITKTALGAENLINWIHSENIEEVIKSLKDDDFQIACLEQSSKSITLNNWKSHNKVAIVVGREVEGIESDVLDIADVIVEIPMLGKKESLNVTQATAIALYHCRYMINSLE